MSVTIIYGSETGTAEHLAETAGKKLTEAGFAAEVKDMADVKAAHLAGFSQLLVITSTWGDGDPPTNAWDLWGELGAKPKIDLSGVRYSVCALGDTAYSQFCKCGIDFDEWLAELGAQRMHPRTDCDLDYEAPFEAWLTGVMAQLKTEASV